MPSSQLGFSSVLVVVLTTLAGVVGLAVLLFVIYLFIKLSHQKAARSQQQGEDNMKNFRLSLGVETVAATTESAKNKPVNWYPKKFPTIKWFPNWKKQQIS